jgi:site-specific DNA-methyltransferase (adenine-specific)
VICPTVSTTACKWDVIIPFEPLWEQYKRIIKSNGAIVLTASQPFTTDVINSNRKLFRYELIWEKHNATGFMQAKKMPNKCHENILLFYRTLPTYNPQKTFCEKFTSRTRFKTNATTKIMNVRGIKSETYSYTDDGSRYPRSVVKINGAERKMNMHPTEKPVELFEWLIKTYTNEGETVLDNCAGSGTTAIACLNTNRNYILMEKEKQYFDMITNRIEKWHSEREPKGLFREAI